MPFGGTIGGFDRRRVVIDVRTIDHLHRLFGRRAGRLAHDAALTILGRHELEVAVAAIEGMGNDESQYVEYVKMGEAVDRGYIDEAVRRMHPRATHVMIVRLGGQDHEWRGRTLRLRTLLPQAAMELAVGRRLADVVSGLDREDDVIVACRDDDDGPGTMITVRSEFVDPRESVGRLVRWTTVLRYAMLDATKRWRRRGQKSSRA
jgi:hypothetical protein